MTTPLVSEAQVDIHEREAKVAEVFSERTLEVLKFVVKADELEVTDILYRYRCEKDKDIEVADAVQCQKYLRIVLAAELIERFGLVGDDFKPYHNVHHSLTVESRALRIFDNIQAIDPDALEPVDLRRAYLTAICMGHDLVQEGYVDGNRFIRYRGADIYPSFREEHGIVGNEAKSAKELFKIMDRFVLPDGKKVFADYPQERVTADIKTTFVNVTSTVTEGKQTYSFVQPYVSESTSLEGIVLSLCDLRGAAASRYDEAKAWGDTEFIETNTDIKALMKQALLYRTNIRSLIKTLPEDQIADMVDRITAWYLSQDKFFAAQKIQTLEVINMIKNEDIRRVLLSMFTLDRKESAFDTNSKKSREGYKLLNGVLTHLVTAGIRINGPTYYGYALEHEIDGFVESMKLIAG